MLKLPRNYAIGFALLFGVACQSERVSFIRSGDILRTADDVRGHVYFLRDGVWTKSAGPVLIPEGWFLGNLPPE